MNGRRLVGMLALSGAVAWASAAAWADKPHDAHCPGHDVPYDHQVEAGANGIVVEGEFSVVNGSNVRSWVHVDQVDGYTANLGFATTGDVVRMVIAAQDIDNHVCDWWGEPAISATDC